MALTGGATGPTYQPEEEGRPVGGGKQTLRERAGRAEEEKETGPAGWGGNGGKGGLGRKRPKRGGWKFNLFSLYFN